MQTLHPDIERVLLGEEQIRSRVADLGQAIAREYADRPGDIVVVSVLRGAAIFAADLVRKIDLPLEMDFIAISSYGASTKSSGVIEVKKDLGSDIRGKHVIIVEDILDSGLSLQFTTEYLKDRGAASVEVAVFLKKIRDGQAAIDARYVGFEVPDEFVVGYGLDYAQRYRNLPYLGVLKPCVYGGAE